MTDSEITEITEEQRALQRRAAEKVDKRRTAAGRHAYLAARSGFVDHTALRASLATLGANEVAPVAADAAPRDAAPNDGAVPGPDSRPLAFPTSNVNRWVPIGPSVVSRGQALGRPRVSGRVRDLAVSPNGQRAYAATARGGVWFTGDGGSTWEPVGGWASEARRFGGNITTFSCGCLLVSFGATAANDFVMVGTGEIGELAFPNLPARTTNSPPMAGMGVLVASAPATLPTQAAPFWEAQTGIAQLEGVSIARLVRVPGSTAGQAGDQVIAATSGGLFLGTRALTGGTLGFTWAPMSAPPAPPAPTGVATVQAPTDLLYVGPRLFVCYRSAGVAFSDDNGATWRWVTMTVNAGLPAATVLIGRMSIAVNDDNNRVYVLGEVNTTPAAAAPSPVAHIWQIANPNLAPPAPPTATPVAGVPTSARLWPGQRDYDQAILVTTFTPPGGPPPPPRVDRVYIGGSGLFIRNVWNASIWAFNVAAGPGGGPALVPAVGVSDQDGTTASADVPGLIGNAIHADVHVLRKANNPGGAQRQIWVGCDGGVFQSLQDGRTNTFASRNVGLASIEAGFLASHPSSSQFAMLGCQDNGCQMRIGESVWEMKFSMRGDGGGVIFHPIQSHYVMGQFIRATWASDPTARYVPPIVGPPADPENRRSAFYSGIAAVVQPAGNRARIALGTNRVWVTDNLGTANPNTWRVLPLTPLTAPPTFAPAIDPRPGNRAPGNQAFGVPVAPALGPVLTVKWASPTSLLALYLRGIVRYDENPGSPGNWTSTTLLAPGIAAPAAPLVNPAATFFTDIEPVPGTRDFYLVCTGQRTRWVPAQPGAVPPQPAQPPVASQDSCFYFDSAAGGFRLTGLGQTLPAPAGSPAGTPSPIDPAYSVVVDPTNVNTVFVGTVTSVWQSTKGAGNAHGPWTQLANGLPESVVQDLSIWTDPAGGANSPRLLRAALQSRGIWEVNLAAPEPVRTYLRVHERDDRRMLPTPMQNPRRRPNAPPVSALRSPDIIIRPEAPVANTPSFRGTNLVNGNLPYQLWTFQTAFRWLFPSVIPNGRWSDQFGDLVERHRRALGLPVAGGASRRIDRALWNAVMAAAQDAAGNAGVYQAPWHTPLAPTAPATEIDLLETVIPRRDARNIWQVYRERSTVDVLLHHRDTRPVAANQAVVVLLWREGRSAGGLAAADCTPIPAFARSLFGAVPQAVPAGWNAVPAADATLLHRLAVPLAARMPRAVSINLDLSAVPSGRRVLLLALAGSNPDQFSAAPSGALDRVDRFVRSWPHAAARVISCWRRPGTQLH